MKKIFSLLVLLFTTVSYSGAQNTKSALLIIDIQNFYFQGGRSELVEPLRAAENASKLLTEFRLKGLPVIHVRHNSEPGGEIHKLVEPIKGEKIISKNEVNCFVGTDLIDYLRTVNISSLVICGMQTHMCVEAAVRAATDLGFSCILISDACATRDLMYNDKLIKAEDIQFSTLSTLKSYAEIETTAEFLDNKQE